MKLAIFATGGTIDKVYFDAKSHYEVGAPTAGEILEVAHCYDDIPIISLMQIDSLDMTSDDRLLIKETIERHPATHCLVTHGTDTMVETAKVLADVREKVIVLAGAMEPTRFRDTDAFFNIGFALGVLRCAAPGAYVTMNGKVFNPFRTRKNLKTGRFEEY